MTDDRTPEEKLTHMTLITATDRFMSGWGSASGGASKCAWACLADDADAVLAWVRARPEMRYVRLRPSYARRWRPRAAHVHVYVVREGHPAVERGSK